MSPANAQSHADYRYLHYLEGLGVLSAVYSSSDRVKVRVGNEDANVQSVVVMHALQ
jgi:hypothetical protein